MMSVVKSNVKLDKIILPRKRCEHNKST